MILGSASAMFWGGQHRFLIKPPKYPFMGGNKGMQEWYNGKPMSWGETSIKSFTTKVAGNGGIIDMVKGFFKDLFGGGLNNLGSAAGDKAKGVNKKDKSNILNNYARHYMASKSKGQIPYLSGLKALLIGEPVGEWHITVGNPLNPIAMIGNLICTSMDLEFGEELGPDDFPTEVKITVNLDHGMARDRDAIQSIFNRGMGRIYDLPDHFEGTADHETKVDPYTGNQSPEGSQPSASERWNAQSLYQYGMDTGAVGKPGTKENVMHSSTSVWNRAGFNQVSSNENLDFISGNNLWVRSEYRAKEWISKSALE